MDAYLLALALVRWLDSALGQGRHFRTRDGQLITTLEQAITALQTDSFQPIKPVGRPANVRREEVQQLLVQTDAPHQI
jgi:acetylglutamate kinase